MARKLWTSQEVDTLKRLYPDCKTETLALLLGRKASVISQKAAVLGIRKSEGFKLSPLSGRMLKGSTIGEATRFTNQTPGWNKGLKQADYMSAEMIERTAQTRFKKGQDPHNTVEIGHERVTRDGYVEVKVNHFKTHGKNDNFKLKHRLLWESHHGPIPEGMIVVFKTDDKINFTIDDLELITMRENVIRNGRCDTAIIKRYLGIKEPEMIEKAINEIPEVIELKRTELILTNKLKSNAYPN